MKIKTIIYLILSISLFSCNYIREKVGLMIIENTEVGEGFITTEKSKELEEKILKGIKPVRLKEYPPELKVKVKTYVDEKYGKNSQYNYVVFYSTVISYSPDTIGYLDTNHYTVNLKVEQPTDTITSFLYYSKNLELEFDSD